MGLMAAGALGRGVPELPLARQASVFGLTAGVAAAVVALSAAVLADVQHPSSSLGLPWWTPMVVFFFAEALPVQIHFRTETHSVTLGELGLVLGLFLVSPGELLVAQFLGAGIALTITRRQRPATVAFNLAAFAFATCVAALVFHGFLLLGEPYGPAGWVGAVVAAAAYSGVSLGLVAAVRWLGSTRAITAELPTLAAVTGGVSFACASLAIAAVELLRHDPRALWVMAFPLAATVLALYSYTTQRRSHGHLEFLSRSMRAMQGAEFRSSVRELLEAARTMLSAEVAEILVFSGTPEEGALRSVISPTDDVLMEQVDITEAQLRVLGDVSAHHAAILLPRGRPRHALDAYLTEEGLDDAIVTALRGVDRVFGMVLVGNRLGDAATFTHDDRRLFETFASHAGALLENDRVKTQLRHQAFHDSLTGLANRVLFTERVHKALTLTFAGQRRPAVLFIDLDDFKTINDSLGHSAGDQLLISVAERVRASIRPDDLVARLGGDEFAVLLERSDREDAESVASRLVEALRAPFWLEGREMRVHASIGIARADNGIVADELLRNADVAMYSAKDNGKGGFAWYDPEMHVKAQRRQELAATLEGSVEREEIEAHYQPIVAMETGRVVGVEALARWRHPARGLVLPDSFIPLAEETGFMPPIGRTVLRLACEQLETWRSRHRFHDELVVSVNLSQSELRNPGLARDVEEILCDTGLPPERLILELTESSAMQDPAGAIDTLGRLRALGVRLALDDFGTGYSSLSHLRDFPIDMLKIAKPFIDRLERDNTFVDAIIRLAQSLELEVVAEGVETQEQAELLRSLGCTLGQGYYYSAPVDALHLGSRLAFGPVVLRPDRRARVA
ncbi:MAG TPA: EAL domain-containing protein [Gaiellaceae bacterium]|nr:EAL domain-containing protein [Gaiellaceae bacterium]